MYHYSTLFFGGQYTVKNKCSWKTLWTLFITFFKLSAFTFGGGYAMLPLLHEDCVERKKWITEEEMLDMLAISESTPGPFVVNAATFVGYHQGGVLGAAASTFGVALPSYIAIMIISLLFSLFRDNVWVDAAFRGIRAAVVVLIINAVIKLSKKLKWNALWVCIALAAFAISLFLDINIIFVLIGAGIVGIVWMFVNGKRMNKKKEK
ncbi:MAG: chromate transporter [Thermoguttaceae bacterium]|nr:chromate transporter [Thermoguttaceae bacterium]